MLFSRKNFLAKFTKQPAEDGPFRAITILFDQALLREYYPRYGAVPEPANEARAAVVSLAPSPKLRGLYESLQPYFERPLPSDLTQHAPSEALQLLLQDYPALQPVLFDFGQPGKIDLEAFMRQSFRFNIAQKQLAYLTGRSLATFKRDFAQIFHTTPGRWLYETRLAEAYYLLQEEHRRPLRRLPRSRLRKSGSFLYRVQAIFWPAAFQRVRSFYGLPNLGLRMTPRL